MLRSLLGHHFWIPSYIALALGMWLPGDWEWVRPGVPLFLGGILFFTCLRIPFGEVIDGLRDRAMLRRAAVMTLLKLMLMPALAWVIAILVAPAWAPGLVLVCAAPAGMSSVTLTDLHRGDRVLALFLILATSLACPLTIPLTMTLVHPGAAPEPVQLAGRALYTLALLAIPFTAAQLLRIAFPRQVARGMTWWGPCSVLCLVILILIATAANQAAWRGSPASSFLIPFALVTGVTLLSLGVSLWLRRIFPPTSTTAFACASLYMNNGLAIAYASAFHQGEAEVILPAFLMQVPMVAAVVLWGRWAHTPATDAPPA